MVVREFAKEYTLHKSIIADILKSKEKLRGYKSNIYDDNIFNSGKLFVWY